MRTEKFNILLIMRGIKHDDTLAEWLEPTINRIELRWRRCRTKNDILRTIV